MEPEQITHSVESLDKFESLKKVTPLSKYLAMTLFIVMPFLGGWIGYTYAPEKVVEVERIVEVKKGLDESQKEIDQNESSVEWQNTEVIYVPRIPGPGDEELQEKLTDIPWESWFGEIKGISVEDGFLTIGFDRMKFYKHGGSCWGLNGYCIDRNDGTIVKLKLEPGALLARSAARPCNDLGSATDTPFIDKDALDIKASCSGTINSNTALSQYPYYWLVFTEEGTVQYIVEQYVP